MKVQRTPRKPMGPLAALVSGWFGGAFVTALALAFVPLLLAAGLADLLGTGAPFRAFPPRIEKTTFAQAYDFFQDCPFSKIDRLEKWTKPIQVRVEGLYDDEDVAVLEEIAKEFSTVKGFPGISLVTSGENVLVSYITMDSYAYYKAKYKSTTTDESYCSHWSTSGVYDKAGIVIRVDEGTHAYRNVVVLHEFFHLVGFQSHTTMRLSIVNSVGPVTTMSSVDLLAFRMLYDPAVEPDMTFAQLKSVFAGRSVSSYLTASPPVVPDDALPDLPIPLALSGAIFLLLFLADLRPHGGGLAFARLLVRCSAGLLVAFLYYALAPQFLDTFRTAIATF